MSFNTCALETLKPFKIIEVIVIALYLNVVLQFRAAVNEAVNKALLNDTAARGHVKSIHRVACNLSNLCKHNSNIGFNLKFIGLKCREALVDNFCKRDKELIAQLQKQNFLELRQRAHRGESFKSLQNNTFIRVA